MRVYKFILSKYKCIDLIYINTIIFI